MRPLRIALTGGIASGKTVVAGFLRELGFAVVEADEIAHAVLKDDSVRQRIREVIGPEVMNGNGEVNRRDLGAVVFGNPDKLRALEAIVHPVVRRRIREREDAALSAQQTVVSVIPLLFEKGVEGGYDRVWATYAPREVCLQRLRERDGITGSEASARFAAQMDPEEKARRADSVINTQCPLEELRRRVADLVRSL
jgi:dephospho-CoA kinase